MSLPIDQVITRLGADLRPLRRLPSPLIRPRMAERLRRLGTVEHRLDAVPDMCEATLGAALTATLGALRPSS